MKAINESLSDEQQHAIWDLFCTGEHTVRGLGKILGIPKSTIHDFISGKTYKNFPRFLPQATATAPRHIFKPRILCLDLETADLYADMHEIFMMGHQWIGEEDEPTVTTFYDFDTRANWYETEKKDAELIQFAIDLINQADMIVTQNGKEFDQRFLQARALAHNLERPVIKNVAHFDTMKVSQKYLRLKSHSMRNLCAFLRTKSSKGGVSRTLWRRAQAHNNFALEKIREYCGDDIRTTVDIFQRLAILDPTMIDLYANHFGNATHCIHCGSIDYEVGYEMYNESLNKNVPAIICKTCKGWSYALD